MKENKENEVPIIPRYGKHNIEKCQTKFKTHFLDKLQNGLQLKQNIISLALNCHLHEELIRPHSWKLFLKTISFNESTTLRNWLDETFKKREDFKRKLKEANEKYELQKKKENQNKTENKFSNFEENSSIKHLIEIDVERTYGDTKLFQDEYIRKMEQDILYVFSQENKPTSYKQGMNEILAIFIHAFYPFYITSPVKTYTPELFNTWCSDPVKYLNQIYSFFHDENELKSDLYYIIYNIMNLGLNKFYEDSVDPEYKNEQKTYLLIRCDQIMDKLRKHNIKLYKHFIEIGLNAEVILQRWLKCIFSREYTPEDCLYIWDNILGNEFNIPSKNLEYIDFFCVAMFDYISDNLLTHDQNECFICLFKYPPFQTIDILVNWSEKVKENILKLDKPKESMFSFSNIKNKISNIKLNDITNIFNKNNNDVSAEQKQEEILAELKKITDNKTRVIQLKNILNKYRTKFFADDRMKIDLLLNSLEKNV